MPSLAHEGNPKEDSITITAGSVLSTAQLDILLIAQGGVPFEVVPPNDPGSSVSSSCPDTLQIASGRIAPIPFFYNDGQSSGSVTVFTDSEPDDDPQTAENPKWLSIAFETGTNCCALAYTSVEMVDIPTIQNVQHGTQANPDIRPQAIYPVHDIALNGVKVQGVSDHPYFGICNFVQDGSTVQNFTGYVLACDVGAGITKLMKYVNQSLCSDGQILGVINGAVNGSGDFFYLNVYTDPNASSDGDTIWLIEAGIEDENDNPIGTPLSLQTHDSLMDVVYTDFDKNPNNVTIQAGERHNRANVGVVAIGGSTLSGIATVGADATHYGIRASCDSFCFSEGEVA